jgi:hypothetical protein
MSFWTPERSRSSIAGAAKSGKVVIPSSATARRWPSAMSASTPVGFFTASGLGGRKPLSLMIWPASGEVRKSRNTPAAAACSVREDTAYETLNPEATVGEPASSPGIGKKPTSSPMTVASCPAAQLPLTRKTLSPLANRAVESTCAVPFADAS